MGEISAQEARAALAAVEGGRRGVVERIAVPAWYWWFVAAGWVVLGVLADLDHPWVTMGATLGFGALHSTVAPRVVHGRRGSRQLSVRAEVAGAHVTTAVIGGLVLLAGVTVAVALALSADGSGHPATGAGVFVGMIVLLGGPMLLARIRRVAQSAGAR
ncbi:hypothetical protein UG55_103928 [Frankia sp. EI5c]|uniref:hypothetical protein n=1 Tax=Frankia sp. EI5c TaxID=683316 RepID=UPI0007C40224|nr:hypothetical protein [Frankia sp. EI5c]OAA23240.1 hypothetical protein UG55_103928 [Frankia sp. EI5c]